MQSGVAVMLQESMHAQMKLSLACGASCRHIYRICLNSSRARAILLEQKFRWPGAAPIDRTLENVWSYFRSASTCSAQSIVILRNS